MGCYSSKAGIASASNSTDSKGSSPEEEVEKAQSQQASLLEDSPEEEVEKKETEPAPEPAPELQQEEEKLEWTEEASQWRRLLRNTQSLLAACLYIVCTWVRTVPRHTPLGQFLLTLLIVPAFTLAYHLLSQNRAGSYYDGYIGMFAHFPQHFRDVLKRGSPEIKHEQENGMHVVRTVNGLETGVLFLLMSWLSALLWPSGPGNILIDCIRRCVETAAFFCLHRIYGANFFPERFQPQGMWHFYCLQSQPACANWKMKPVLQNPTSY